ncbi:hypothetical protein DFH06DRAFT_1326700 [Mycena polygramma]|nr:hypothetical protein DFH06DRAFT_1326700 [Mycena polygramma]
MYWLQKFTLWLVPPTLAVQQRTTVITGTVSPLLWIDALSFKYRGHRNRAVKMQFSSEWLVYELGDGEPSGRSDGNSVARDLDSCDDGGSSLPEKEAFLEAEDVTDSMPCLA